MHTYEVHFTWQGRRYIESVTCSTPLGAIAAVRGRYPGALIGHVTKVH